MDPRQAVLMGYSEDKWLVKPRRRVIGLWRWHRADVMISVQRDVSAMTMVEPLRGVIG